MFNWNVTIDWLGESISQLTNDINSPITDRKY